MRTRSLTLSFTLLAAVLATPSAQALPTQDLFDLPLEALMDLPVETPSKLPQSLSGAAGVVSLFSRDDIALFGGRNLGDVLGRITGVQPLPSSYLQSPLTVRSDAASVNNNHVLILLNGMPFNREGYLGGLFNHLMLTSIPLDAIQQIEVVRGPGAVLYGTNAFAGVINIITRDETRVRNQVSVAAGNAHTHLNEASLAHHGDDYQVAGFFQYYDTDGPALETHAANGTPFEMEQGVHAPGGLVTGQFGALRVNAYWGESDYDQRRGTVLTPLEGETAVEKRFLNLGYDLPLNTRWQLKLDAGLIQSLPFIQVNAIDTLDYHFNDSHYELQLLGALTPNVQWVSGLTRDDYQGRVDPELVPDWHYGSWSGYSELQYQWHDTRLIGGVQLNKAENVALNTVPRLGLIQQFTAQTGLKLMHGEAFRAPAIGETDINSPVALGLFTLRGNPDLEHERVTTTDLQFFYNGSDSQLALTLFRTAQKDLIVRTLQGNIITFINQGELNIEGVELEGKAVLAQNWYMLGSATWQQNEDGNGVEDVTLQPATQVKLGLAYRTASWSAGLYNSHFSTTPDNRNVVPTRLLLNPPADAWNLLSLNLNLHLPTPHDAQVEIYLDNLLNETVYRPMIPGTGVTSNTEPYLNGRYGQIGIRASL